MAGKGNVRKTNPAVVLKLLVVVQVIWHLCWDHGNAAFSLNQNSTSFNLSERRRIDFLKKFRNTYYFHVCTYRNFWIQLLLCRNALLGCGIALLLRWGLYIKKKSRSRIENVATKRLVSSYPVQQQRYVTVPLRQEFAAWWKRRCRSNAPALVALVVFSISSRQCKCNCFFPLCAVVSPCTAKPFSVGDFMIYKSNSFPSVTLNCCAF